MPAIKGPNHTKAEAGGPQCSRWSRCPGIDRWTCNAANVRRADLFREHSRGGVPVMPVFRITVEWISTGERGSGGIVRCGAEARAHAEEGIRCTPTPDDFCVVDGTRDRH